MPVPNSTLLSICGFCSFLNQLFRLLVLYIYISVCGGNVNGEAESRGLDLEGLFLTQWLLFRPMVTGLLFLFPPPPLVSLIKLLGVQLSEMVN